MDKNSLILDIKNDLNSIKKQIDVALAKLAVLESMVELDNKLGVNNGELGVRSEELGVKEPKQECRDNACIVREPEPAPVAEPVEAPVEKLGVNNGELGVGSEELGVNNEELGVRSEELGVKEIKPEAVVEPEPEKEAELVPNCEALVLRNLMSIIGLNDRFRFRHDLFSDDNDLFRETIDILNTLEDFEKAVDFLEEKFNWDPEDATVVYFYDIIKPKF